MNEAERHALQAEIFWRLHEGLPKQGPGSDATTRRALKLAAPLPEAPVILDLGCGPGRQTLVLAGDLGGRVTAMDLLPPFLEQLEARADAAGLSERITTQCASIGDLSPAVHADGSVDLIWSEGAIYNVGFDFGLGHWRRLLTPGGRVGVSEVSWLVDDPPEPVRSFWDAHYPAIRTREENERAIVALGYRPLGQLVVPQEDWWTDYYSLIEERVETLRNERDDESWQAMIALSDEELEIVRIGLSAFGYVFYVMELDGQEDAAFP